MGVYAVLSVFAGDMSELTVINPTALNGHDYFEMSSNNGKMPAILCIADMCVCVLNTLPNITPCSAALFCAGEKEVAVVIDLEERRADTAPAVYGAVDLETVLHTRPTLALGRLSFRRKYHSLRHERSPPAEDGATIPNPRVLRRTSSLPGAHSHSPLTLQDIEELTLEEHPSSLQAASQLRKSTRRLKERIADQ